ncbi:hypothetical protein BH24GEM2_BH24GEM2_12240 [soil metagenome]|jgi:hypothetical protein
MEVVMRQPKLLFVTALATALVAGCKVDRTREGELPEVDVRGGQLPKFDIDPARVDVRMDTQTIVVPKVEVTPRQGNNP